VSSTVTAAVTRLKLPRTLVSRAKRLPGKQMISSDLFARGQKYQATGVDVFILHVSVSVSPTSAVIDSCEVIFGAVHTIVQLN